MKTKLLMFTIMILFLTSSIIPSTGLQVNQIKIEPNNTIKNIEDEVKNFLSKEEIDVNKDLKKLKELEKGLKKEIEKKSDIDRKLQLITLLNEVKSETAWLEDMRRLPLKEKNIPYRDNLNLRINKNRISKNFSFKLTKEKIDFSKQICVKKISNRNLKHGNDIIADDVFLSSQPGDWKKEHLVTDPKAGDKIYIHWVYSTYGTIGSFHIRIKLYTLDNEKVIDWSYTPDKDSRKDGWTYTVCFSNPWIAPGGYDYQLSEIVDSGNEIKEDNEDNNIATLEFTVSGEKFDIEAYDIYLSSKPGDSAKNYVVTNPKAGDELYIHFKYIIYGIPDKIVDPFYIRIKLVDNNDKIVINVEEKVARKNRKAGYIYTLYLAREDGGGWIAPGGDYGLGGEVDINKEIDEWNENNNLAGIDFSVTPKDEKFDLIAEDVWLSSTPNDWDKKHVINPPVDPDKEIFFHFQWNIIGNPDTMTPIYNIKFVLDGPGGFEFENTVDKQDYRKANTIVKACLLDENGNGWYAVRGSYRITFKIDSSDEIKEWNENNNQKKLSFTVGKYFYPNDGGRNTTTSFLGWANADWLTSGASAGEAYSKTHAWLLGVAVAASWLQYKWYYAPSYNSILKITVKGKFKGHMGCSGLNVGNYLMIVSFIYDTTNGKIDKRMFKYVYDEKDYTFKETPYTDSWENKIIAGHDYIIGVKLEAEANVLLGGSDSKFDWTLDRITIELQ